MLFSHLNFPRMTIFDYPLILSPVVVVTLSLYVNIIGLLAHPTFRIFSLLGYLE